MANVIIGIHGLGNKPPAQMLEKWWKMSMTEGLKTNNLKTVLPEFKLVFWSDILHDKPLDLKEKDASSPYFTDEKYEKAPDHFPVEDYSTRSQIVDFIGRQLNRIFLNADLTLNYSFISDVIINRYFRDLEIYYCANIPEEDKKEYQVKDLIRDRLCMKLKEHRHDNIMLISHSMGSVIAFEVLTFMVPEIRINTFVTMGSPLGLPVIISKIAGEYRQRGMENYIVKTPPGVINKWYNFSDILDKVAFNYKLSDYYSENEYSVKPTDFLVINNYEYNGIRNPHKSFGYLRCAEFSTILNEFILTGKITVKQRITQKVKESIKKIKAQVLPDKKPA